MAATDASAESKWARLAALSTWALVALAGTIALMTWQRRRAARLRRVL